MTYTEEQKAIGRHYANLAMAYINDDEKYNEVMAEFEEIKKGWVEEKQE